MCSIATLLCVVTNFSSIFLGILLPLCWPICSIKLESFTKTVAHEQDVTHFFSNSVVIPNFVATVKLKMGKKKSAHTGQEPLSSVNDVWRPSWESDNLITFAKEEEEEPSTVAADGGGRRGFRKPNKPPRAGPLTENHTEIRVASFFYTIAWDGAVKGANSIPSVRLVKQVEICVILRIYWPF